MTSLSDFIDSLKGEVQEKSRNPFFPTFIVIWVIRHWEPVYSFFFFGDVYNLDQRILKFKAYFQNYSLWDLGITILITFGTILLGYLLANITRLVTNLFENKITPFVYYLTAPGKIVMKSELDDLQKDFDDLERRFDAVRVEKSRLANEVEELLKRKSDRNPPKQIANNDDDLLEKYGIRSEKTGESFIEISTSIGKGEMLIKNSGSVAKFTNLGLIKLEVTSRSNPLKGTYSLTPEGREIYRILTGDR